MALAIDTDFQVNKLAQEYLLNLRRIDFDSSYPVGGEALTPANLGFSDDADNLIVLIPNVGDHRLEYDGANEKIKVRWNKLGMSSVVHTVDDNDNAATVGHALYVVPVPTASPITLVSEGGTGQGTVDHDANAATVGVAVYVVLDEEEFLPGYALGHLEFVSPTAAHGTCTIFSGGPTLLLEHDAAAATNGVVVRAIAADGGLEATLAGSGRSVLVAVSSGAYIAIADSTTGSTPTVYFDEDAANTYERLKAVMVDVTDETFELVNIQADSAFRPGPGGGVRLASLVTVGPGATYSKGNAGSGGPEFTVTHDQAAAIMAGAAPLYVQAAGAGFNAAVPGGEDVYVPLGNGELFKIAYAASPAGVQVYWDHDATSSHLRMLGVIVDNLDETVTLWAEGGEVPEGTDLSALTNVSVLAFGRKPV